MFLKGFLSSKWQDAYDALMCQSMEAPLPNIWLSQLTLIPLLFFGTRGWTKMYIYTVHQNNKLK